MLLFVLITSLVVTTYGANVPSWVSTSKLSHASQVQSPISAPYTTVPQNRTDRIVCHLGKSRKFRATLNNYDFSEINEHYCSHLIVSEISINKDGKITITEMKNFLNNLRILRNRNVKILWSWGGWTTNTRDLTAMICRKKTRLFIIKQLVNWILANDADGLNLDWEYNQVIEVDIESQLTLLKDLSLEFKKQNLLLSVDVSGNLKIIKHNYNLPTMSQYVNWINLKAYELDFPSSKSHLLAPLYNDKSSRLTSVDDLVRKLLASGIAPLKLILGIPFTGRLYTLADQYMFLPESPVIELPKTLNYANVCRLLHKSWDVRWQKPQNVYWAVKNNEWLTWSNPRFVVERVKYAKYMNLGGVAAWGIGSDDTYGFCGGPTLPLLKSISSVTYDSRNRCISMYK